ncbi:NAD(P)H-dependent glycerol-3-phosphate dehydrogenase [Alphaproteobacteria bacterium]|nr:NAD(P)H-dependent glycerol-3-phosphate dehydrogenase [Alphaproteobacteria bacterium]
MTRHVVIGGGSWGSAIASSLQRAQQPVTVLSRNQQTADMLARGQCEKLPDCDTIAPLDATTDDHCLAAATVIFVAVPVQANKDSFTRIAAKQAGASPAIVALCAKGIVSNQQGEAMLLTTLAQNMLPRHDIVVFSGPSFADEVFSGLPAALVAAGNDAATKIVQDSFESSNLRVYRNTDSVGVALAGAMKNVIAIAAGCAVGLGLGDNAKAAILTRGLSEIARFSAVIGAKSDTIFGLAGVGDLALTCAGPHSRNMAFGMALGRGETPSSQLAEGSRTVAALANLAAHHKIDLPITNAVDKLVNHGEGLQQIVAGLLARPAHTE